MSALEKWVSPTGSGTKDGDSPANARGISTDADRSWLLSVYAGWHTAMLASATDTGLAQPRTHTTVKPGTETRYGQAFTSMIEDVKSQLVYARVHWISDAGTYDVSGVADSSGWFTTTSAHSGTPTSGGTGAAGSSTNPHRVIVNNAYRLSDDKRSDQVAGAVETRTASLPSKDLSTASDTDAANYGSDGFWTGPTKTISKTWSANLPSPIAAKFTGARTPDPRTAAQRASRMWNLDTSTTRKRAMPSPLATNAGADSDDGTGARVLLSGGDVVDFTTTPPSKVGSTMQTASGCYVIRAGASYMAWEGFSFLNVRSPFTFSSTSPGAFKSFRDITSENTKYGIWRDDYQNDIEAVRWKTTTSAQKHFAPGLDCQRWFISDQVYDGGYVVGDPIQNLISVASDYSAQSLMLRRCIIERCWDAVDTSSTYYPNGDGIEAESLGLAVHDTWIDKTTDGGIDSKSGPLWENSPSRVYCNLFLGHGRREMRLWAPSFPSRRVMQNKTIVRDVTTFEPRQYHAYLVGASVSLNEIHWTNPSGVAHFAGAANGYAAVSNDGTTGGDMAVILRRPFDGRTGTQKKFEGANSTPAFTGAAPYKIAFYTPRLDAADIGVSADGTVVDTSVSYLVQDGQTKRFALTNLPSGSTVTWSEIGPGEGVDVTGQKYDVTFRTV